jgi:hypothetical protein
MKEGEGSGPGPAGDRQSHQDSDQEEDDGDDEEEVILEAKVVVANEIAAPPAILGRCCGCSAPWDKYRGKKRCPICGVPLLLCPTCLSHTDQHQFKCSLCKEDEALGRKPFNKKEHYRQVAEEIITVDPTAQRPVVKKKAKCLCGVCSVEFPSRNALFKHLTESGHHNRRAKKKR